MDEQLNAIIDESIRNTNSICKDDGMLDRFSYIMIKRMVDRFGITPEEAFEFMVKVSNEAFEFALNAKTEE